MDDILKIKDLNPIGANLKESAELPITHEGVTYKTSVAEIMQKVSDKNTDKYLLKSEKIPNENLTFGEVKERDTNVVSGGEVFEKTQELRNDIDRISLRTNLFNPINIIENVTVGVTDQVSKITAQEGSAIGFAYVKKGEYYLQIEKFNIKYYRCGVFDSLDVESLGVRHNNNVINVSEDYAYIAFNIAYNGDWLDLSKIQLENGNEPTKIVPYSEIELINQKDVDKNTQAAKIVDANNRYVRKVVGKNLIDFKDLLTGVTYSSTSGLVEKEDGILSNKIRFSPGDYCISGVQPYATQRQRVLAFNDKDEMISAIAVDKNNEGNYVYKHGVGQIEMYANYYRIVLQYEDSRPFNVKTAQIEKGNKSTEFENTKVDFIENSYYLNDKYALLSGASNATTGNGWFEYACEKSGFKYNNVAVSGESVMQHATKAWRGELYTFEQLDKMDALVLSHTHNYNVNFNGVHYFGEFLGYKNFSNSGILNTNDNYLTYKYNVKKSVIKLLVSTICAHSSSNYIACFDENDVFISSFLKDENKTATNVLFELDVPENTAYILVKKYNVPNFKIEVKGLTAGILQGTISEYENKGYDETNKPLTVPLDKNNPNHRIVPYGGRGASGLLIENNTFNERYSAGFDYLIKKYKADCLELKNNPLSKWYNSPFGKPAIIVICSYWHDGYVVYNNSSKELAKRVGAIYCDIADNVGISYEMTNPLDIDSIRESYLYCNNRLFGGGNDAEKIPIKGVEYTGMGWHATRDMNSKLTVLRGNILSDVFDKI